VGQGEHPGAGARRLRELPAVHELAAALDAPHALAVQAARSAIDEQRAAIRERRAASGADPVAADPVELAQAHLERLLRPSLRHVLNATGVIVHTNLGRAPLPQAAIDAVTSAAGGYSNLELDLDQGTRGSRHAHVEALLRELTGAEAAIVVNNGAGAVLLAAAALAGPGKPIIVSRGQLVEIGGGFRIPDVIAQSGSELREVGTTNRTKLADYRRAITEDATILRVHQSNFRTLGFVEEVAVDELTALGVPVIDDVGSGVLADASGIPALGDEPSLKRSVAAGAALVCCSGDKLLGGPQAGILIGANQAIAAARSHPLARALRLDKLSLAALEATLRVYREPERARAEIPVLAMLDASEETLDARATVLREQIGDRATLARASAKVGGGALPLLELEGPVVAVDVRDPADLAARLRAAEPPVIARIHDGRLLLDPRTLTDAEAAAVATAVRNAIGG
jgi:L-seryl-tRNA(Ser) seleniumtransferase